MPLTEVAPETTIALFADPEGHVVGIDAVPRQVPRRPGPALGPAFRVACSFPAWSRANGPSLAHSRTVTTAGHKDNRSDRASRAPVDLTAARYERRGSGDLSRSGDASTLFAQPPT